MRKLLLIAFVMLFMALQGFGQSRSITGRVTDKSAGPLEAVTVVVVETQKAALTDKDGKFTIQAVWQNK